MGNHEFCTGCHESDFHRGQTCEEAYPESRKKVLARQKELDDEQKVGKELLLELKKKLVSEGVSSSYLSIEYSEFGGWHLDITAFALARKKNA